MANYKFDEVWICFPESGASACTLALVWNWTDNKLGVRVLSGVTCGATGQIPAALAGAQTWDGDTGSWDTDGSTWDGTEYLANDLRTMLGNSGAFGLIDTGTSDYGANMAAALERRGLHFDEPARVKIVRSLLPVFDGPTGTVVNIELGAAMVADQLPVYSAPVPFTLGVDQKIDAFASGRFLAVRITSSSAGIWRLRSMRLDLRLGGAF